MTIELQKVLFEAIGTHWSIEYELPGGLTSTEVEQAISGRIEHFDKTYSRFRDDSLVRQIAQAAGTYTFPADAQPLFALYQQLYRVSEGLVTPLIGRMMEQTGYDAVYSLKPEAVIDTPPAWEQAIDYVHPILTARQPVVLDFGAAGKGYLVDIIAELLDSYDITDFIIDAGGDLLRRGAGSIRVGLEDPHDTTQAIGVVNFENGALCASSAARRAWPGYHHIMNPETRQSVSDVTATFVLADTALQADGLATALFFTSPERLAAFDFEYCLLRADRSLERSPGFIAELFVEEQS